MFCHLPIYINYTSVLWKTFAPSRYLIWRGEKGETPHRKDKKGLKYKYCPNPTLPQHGP